MAKGCLNFSFFLWFLHWWNCLCETDWLGVCTARTLKKYKNFVKMSSDFHFTVKSWFLGNVCVKTYFNTQCSGYFRVEQLDLGNWFSLSEIVLTGPDDANTVWLHLSIDYISTSQGPIRKLSFNCDSHVLGWIDFILHIFIIKICNLDHQKASATDM